MTKEALFRLTGFQIVAADEKHVHGWGTLFGYPVAARVYKDGHLELLFTAKDGTVRTVRQIQKKLNSDAELKGKLTITATEYGTQNLFLFLVTLKSSDELEARHLYDLMLSRLSLFLSETEKISPAKNCAICDQDGGDMLTLFEGNARIVHNSCLHRWKNENMEKMETKSQTAGHLQGVLGGVLGGIVGSIPAFAALRLTNYVVWFLFALIPLGIYYGWKLFGGKLTRITLVFTIIYALILAFVVEVIDTFIILRSYFGDWVTLQDTLEAYFVSSPVRATLLQNALMALGATLVGIFVAWRAITKTDKGQLIEVQIAVDMAVPISAVDRQLSQCSRNEGENSYE